MQRAKLAAIARLSMMTRAAQFHVLPMLRILVFSLLLEIKQFTRYEMRWFLLLTLFFSMPGYSATKEFYMNQYRNLPCSGLITRISDIETKYDMGTIKQKKEYRKLIKALEQLRYDKKCSSAFL